MLASRVRMGGAIDNSLVDIDSDKLLGGNLNAGYFGVVSADSLYTGDELASKLGITEGISQFSDAGWLKFAIDGKIIYKSKKTFRHSISWDHINSKGCVDGTKKITKDGVNYKVRLMKGGNGDASNYSEGIKVSEWNKLILPIHEKATDQSWRSKNNVDIPTENWKVWFTDAELQTHSSSGEGSRHWCQESNYRASPGKTIRGNFGVSWSDYFYSSTTTSDCGWSPVLEVISQ